MKIICTIIRFKFRRTIRIALGNILHEFNRKLMQSRPEKIEFEARKKAWMWLTRKVFQWS